MLTTTALIITGWMETGEAFGRDPAGQKMREVGQWWCAYEFFPRHIQRAYPRRAIIERTDAAGNKVWKGPSYKQACEAGGLWRHYGTSWHNEPGWIKYKLAKGLRLQLSIPLIRKAGREGWTDPDFRREVQRLRSPYQGRPLGTHIVPDIATALGEPERFNALYVDCPWLLKDSKNPYGGAAKHYPLMSKDELKALLIRQLARDTAFLLMWVPSAILPDGIEVMQAWGFTYKNVVIWCKEGRFGPGSYFRNGAELLLLGTLPGSGTFVDRSLRNWFIAKPGIHSAKPPEVYDMIERAVPGGPYIEIFATQSRPGWTACGNMVNIK